VVEVLQRPEHYNYFRDYDSTIGRYIESDPIGLKGGLNTFAYAYDAPLRLTDPMGLAIWICNRKAWGVDAGVNHAYLYDDRKKQCCGMNRPHDPLATCKEPGPPTHSCNKVDGSDGFEDPIIKCCQKKSGKSWWPKYDCHDLANECVKDSGFTSPGAPGGRFGECGSCSK
jgi:hypothetical protein